MRVKVFIPKHSSSLNHPPKIRFSDGIDTNEGAAVHNVNTHEGLNYKTLQIFVHRERAMWNIFEPLFGRNEIRRGITTTRNTSSNILSSYHREKTESCLAIILEMSRLSFLKPCNSSSFCKFDICYDDNDIDNKDKNEDGNIDATNRQEDNYWDETTFYTRTKLNNRKRNNSRTESSRLKNNENNNQNQNKNSFLVIYILPPTSFSINVPNMQPERIFTSSLVRLENLQIKLQSMNAYIATLGGGYFLCHYLSTAVSLARYQRQIALRLNDVNLAMKCTINEAYNYIHAGMIHKALLLIQEVQVMAQGRKNSRMNCGIGRDTQDEDVILSMCNAAKWFAGCVRDNMRLSNKENERSKVQNNSKNGSMVNQLKENNGSQSTFLSATHDDFQRIRVVRVKNVSKNMKII